MLRFHNMDTADTPLEELESETSSIFIAHTKQQFVDLHVDTYHSNILSALKIDDAGLLFMKGAAERLKPSRDNSCTMELLVPLTSSGNLRRVVVGLLPTECSRNNTPSFSHSVASIVQVSHPYLYPCSP